VTWSKQPKPVTQLDSRHAVAQVWTLANLLAHSYSNPAWSDQSMHWSLVMY